MEKDDDDDARSVRRYRLHEALEDDGKSMPVVQMRERDRFPTNDGSSLRLRR
jgi:hypothetical protein